ncbi:anosmin-1-like [Lycorma delicatula]|uniref:anosmin-1-like n=1 Tax=Lycorma delicatula TaxID=130591 RepID=UPI003F5179B7
MGLVARMTLLTIVVRLACLFLLGYIPSLSARPRSSTPVLQARCEAACNETTCTEECLNNLSENPGECPVNTLGLEAACIKECSTDIQCPETKKCCSHSCGATCQTPVGLLHYTGLPDIPHNLTVHEIRKNKAAQVSWSLNEEAKAENESQKIVYVLEQCSHPGRLFNSASLGPWTTRLRTKRSTIVVKDLQPGNWYTFRVASVNKNGTRGFSQISQPFTLSEEPSPPEAPKNLRVANTGVVDGLVWGELLWDPPQSDLPILRYKVFWSVRLLPGPPPSPLLVQHKNVPHDKTSFILKKLKPNAEYFLQVEAYSQFGKERLKGEKGNLAFNTTDYKNDSIQWNSGRIAIKKSWVKWVNDELKAHITWSGAKYLAGSIPKFIVTWKSTMPCSAKKIEMSATTHNTYFDLFGLEPGCKYFVNVKEIGLRYSRSKGIYIATPA